MTNNQSEALKSIKNKINELLKPPENLEIWEWGEKHFKVPGDAASPGPWKVKKVWFIKGIMEIMKRHDVTEIIFCAAAQSTKTTAALICTGYALSESGTSVLWIMPTKELSENFSKEKYAKFIKSTKVRLC